MTDELIRLQVRVQQLETALRDICEVHDNHDIFEFSHEELCGVMFCMATAALPTPPSPPTEAHNMRELQVSDDDTA